MVNMPPPGSPDHFGRFGYPSYPPPGSGFPEFPAPGYPPPGYGPPWHPGHYPPPGYAHPGQQPPDYPPPGFAPPPGHGPMPGYGPPPALKPGVIPLRPLTLSDIFNGAVGYMRANPKTTLGLTAVVIVVMQLITLVVNSGPLTAVNRSSHEASFDYSGSDIAVWTIATIAGVLATGLGSILLSGMLTVVVGRAVFGASITVAEAWGKLRGRLLPLIGLAALIGLGAALLIAVTGLVLVTVAAAVGRAGAVLVGLVLVPALIGVCAYLYTMVSFASPLIVLERLPIFAAMGRSFALIRNSFWRVAGILLLAALVANLIAALIGFPFSFAGMMLTLGADSPTPTLLSNGFTAVGSTIGQIITAPFSAGVVVLLYTDRRIRAEAFDLVLQTGAVGGSTTESADSLWLTRPV